LAKVPPLRYQGGIASRGAVALVVNAVPITTTRLKLGAVFTQRCFYLFVALVVLVAAAPILVESRTGRIVANAINILILFAATAAVSRSNVAFAFSSLLAIATVIAQALALVWNDARFLPVAAIFAVAFYLVTISHLLRYVLLPSILDMDKLYGAAAVYLMMGVMWAYIYGIIQYFFPGAFVISGQAGVLVPADFLYYSFTILTTVGFGDIVPVLPAARSATILQQVSGVLYVAILIARLAGVYPPDRAAD
jgi:hypothetical protein